MVIRTYTHTYLEPNGVLPLATMPLSFAAPKHHPIPPHLRCSQHNDTSIIVPYPISIPHTCNASVIDAGDRCMTLALQVQRYKDMMNGYSMMIRYEDQNNLYGHKII